MTYIDIYPTDSIKGKGVLCLKEFPTIKTIQNNAKLTIYNENKEKIGHLDFRYGCTYFNNEGQYVANTVLLYPFKVCKQSEGYYLISNVEMAHNSNYNSNKILPDKFYLSKSELEKYEFRYISLENILTIYKKHPYLCYRILASLVPPYYSLPDSDQSKEVEGGVIPMFYNEGRRPFMQYYALKVTPNTDAPFVDMKAPYLDGKKRIISQDGEWFEIEYDVFVIYNGSSDPRVCARSAFQKVFNGYWKAPYDDNGYPYLLTNGVYIWDYLPEIEYK